MKNKLLSVVAVAMTAVCFVTGCGSKSASAKEIDVDALVSSLVNDVTYEESLEELSSDAISNYITMEDGVSAVMYMSSGATAEEVAVFTCDGEDSLYVQQDNVQAFLDDQYDSFKDYIPEQADLVKNAIVYTNGNYLVVCVTSDTDTASDIIDKAFE